MPVTIKAPNADEIFDTYKQKAPKKELEKAYGVKGAIFNIDQVTAAEYVQNVQKGCVFYFQYKEGPKTAKASTEELYSDPRKIDKVEFYDFGTSSVPRAQWKKKEGEVPGYNTLYEVKCDKCAGNGYTACDCKNTGVQKCATCNGTGTAYCASCEGTGKVQNEITVYDAQLAKKKVAKQFQCPDCYGSGTLVCADCNGQGKMICKKCGGKKGLACKECGGTGMYLAYSLIPVPFGAAGGLEDKLFPSLKMGKFEKEMDKELADILPETDAIKIKKVDDLTQKIIEPNLGYFDSNIKTAMGNCIKEFKILEKGPGTKPQYPIYVFPLHILDCKTKKGSSFQVFSIGTEAHYITQGTL